MGDQMGRLTTYYQTGETLATAPTRNRDSLSIVTRRLGQKKTPAVGGGGGVNRRAG